MRLSTTVLGQQANIALLPPRRDSVARDLFDWLGTERIPRLRDVVNTVRGIAGRPCEDSVSSSNTEDRRPS